MYQSNNHLQNEHQASTMNKDKMNSFIWFESTFTQFCILHASASTPVSWQFQEAPKDMNNPAAMRGIQAKCVLDWDRALSAELSDEFPFDSLQVHVVFIGTFSFLMSHLGSGRWVAKLLLLLLWPSETITFTSHLLRMVSTVNIHLYCPASLFVRLVRKREQLLNTWDLPL